MSDISVMSQELWEELGEPVTPTAVSISGWLSTNISKLNILVDCCYSVVSGDFVPPFDCQLSGIYKQAYLVKNLEDRVRRGLDSSIYYPSGANVGTLYWTKIEEGDSKITRASPAEMMKVLKSERDSAKTDLDDLVFKYNYNAAKPNQVAGEDDQWPPASEGWDIQTNRNGRE